MRRVHVLSVTPYQHGQAIQATITFVEMFLFRYTESVTIFPDGSAIFSRGEIPIIGSDRKRVVLAVLLRDFQERAETAQPN